MIAATLYGLNRALVRAAWPAGERTAGLTTTAALLIGWFAASLALAWYGAYDGAPDGLPTIPFGIFVPIVIGALLIWRSPTVARIIDAVPQHWLIGMHVTRVLGASFLVLFAAGLMPGLFAVPAGLGDLAVVALAPVVAYASVRDPQGSAGAVTRWNLLGLGDFLVAIATGFATGPSPFQAAAFDNPNTLIGAFPLVLIPVFLVPLWCMLHIASLAKLRRAAVQAATLSRSAA
jgi:hypothetical protein